MQTSKLTPILMFAALLTLLAIFVQPAHANNITSKQSSLYFTKNQGQWPDEILFRAEAGGATVWIAKNAIYYQFSHITASQFDDPSTRLSRDSGIPGLHASEGIETMLIKANFVGAIRDVQVTAEYMTDYKCNYFLGNDQTKWATDVPNYEAVTLHGIYDGIDLHFSGNEHGNLMCEYQLSPAADKSRIQVEYQEVMGSSLEAVGDGSVQTKWGTISSLLGTSQASTEFLGLLTAHKGNEAAISSLAPSSPDNVALIYSTYLGGAAGNDVAHGIAVDGAGSVYIAGKTSAAGFPLQSPYDPTHNGSQDIFISKLSPSGGALIYSTYVGGSAADIGYGVAVDGSGHVYLTGETSSSDFPVQSAFDGTYNNGGDAFVSKISPAGNALQYSTYLGGSGSDFCIAIAVDTSGNAYATGATTSNSSFPLQNAYDATYNGGSFDVFVSEFSASGSSLLYSTLLGGNIDEIPYDIDVDASGSAYVSGFTSSIDFPVQNAYSSNNGGGADAFVTKFSVAGGSLLFSSYFGGSGDDFAYGADVDSVGNVYLTGETVSSDLPLLNPLDGSLTGASDAFVSKLSTSTATLLYSTYLGGSGSGNEIGEDIAIDAAGCAYVTGRTPSSDFPMQNHVNVSYSGGKDAFVSKLSQSGNALPYSIFIGGSADDLGYFIAIDANQNAYITGQTNSANFPTKNAYDASYNGSDDGFVTKLSIEYVCGDADGNGIVNISDAVLLINYIFSGGPAPVPVDRGDADCNGILTISDAVYLINYIFSGGPSPCSSCP